jgi:hypothetical protein
LRNIAGKALQLAVQLDAKYAAGRIGDASLALIGEIKVAVCREMQIISSFKDFCLNQFKLFIWIQHPGPPFARDMTYTDKCSLQIFCGHNLRAR